MTRNINPLAGKPAPASLLIDIPKLVAAFYDEIPDSAIPKQQVIFGTSGHRGSSLTKSFNEWHILAITQAICIYRKQKNIDGPLFLGLDTHALSVPAFETALSVLTANDVTVMIAPNNEYTPTPAVSHAILTYNKGRTAHLADGIIITPSHNPPADGGFKYNPPSGGPAGLEITNWIEKKANEFLTQKLRGIRRISFEKALKAPTIQYFNFLDTYVNDLGNVINMRAIADAKIRIGVDPMGGAGIHYWEPIASRYHLNLEITHSHIDPTFRFMTVDWDGQIRMNPASPYAMVNLIKLKDRFDIAFACDTDHDRHGIVTPKGGLLPTDSFLSVAISYLFTHRPLWAHSKSVSKTVVCSQMINWVASGMGLSLYEVPVGFKWFVEGLLNGSLAFCGEQSAGAVFDRINGDVWTTDKDGIVPGLLAAEITAVLNKDIQEIYQGLENKFRKTFYKRTDTQATTEEKAVLLRLSKRDIKEKTLAGDKIETILTCAPGNGAPIGGVKVISQNGWFLARPSGTEAIYEVFAESFISAEHLQQILDEAQKMVTSVLHSAAKIKSTER